MKRVVLLGDSIRLSGYGKRVAELLKDEYDVWQPSDNCRFTQYTLRGLFDWKEQLLNADVVHWNCGLWDECRIFEDGKSFTDMDFYVRTMLRIADILKSYGVKRIIFATTTPVTKKYVYDRSGAVAQFNAALVPKLIEKGIEIDDLYSVVAADPETNITSADGIHLSETGIERCAEAVCKAIRG